MHSRNGRKIGILLAEDDPQQQFLLERAIKLYFKDKPVTVFATDTLAEAISLERLRGPMTVSIIDLNLKDSTGENTMKHFLQLGKFVIAMSGVASEGTFGDCKRYGARDYVEKPIVVELVIEKIARILDNSEPGHEYVEIQRKAQTDLTQKAVAAPAVVVAPQNLSKWARVIWPSVGVGVTVMAAVGGFVAGGWRTAQGIGAEKQFAKDKLERIESDVTEIKDGNKRRDSIQQTLRIEITKLLVKAGLQPEPASNN